MLSHAFKKFWAFAAIYLIWGSTFLAIKYTIEVIPPFLMMGIRSVIAGSILFLLSRLREQVPITKGQIVPLITLGIAFFLIGHGSLAWGQVRVASGIAALLIASQPIFVAIIETSVILKYRPKLREVAGLLLGLAGALMLILPTRDFQSSSLWGALAILAGTVCWASASVYSRKANVPRSSFLTAGVELIIGGVALLLFGSALGETAELRLDRIHARAIVSLLYLILFGSVISFTAYLWLLSHTPATRVSTHTYVNPIVAVFLGWLFANEPVGRTTILAAIAILFSVYLVLTPKERTRA